MREIAQSKIIMNSGHEISKNAQQYSKAFTCWKFLLGNFSLGSKIYEVILFIRLGHFVQDVALTIHKITLKILAISSFCQARSIQKQ